MARNSLRVLRAHPAPRQHPLEHPAPYAVRARLSLARHTIPPCAIGAILQQAGRLRAAATAPSLPGHGPFSVSPGPYSATPGPFSVTPPPLLVGIHTLKSRPLSAPFVLFVDLQIEGVLILPHIRATVLLSQSTDHRPLATGHQRDTRVHQPSIPVARPTQIRRICNEKPKSPSYEIRGDKTKETE